MHTIRPYTPTDWPALWRLLQTTFSSGETYAYAPGSTEADIHIAWVEQPLATYVAVCPSTGALLGTYTLKANQPGLGSHVGNCGYVVAEHARGQGIAASLCEHSQLEAIAHGFRAMQFNLVVATNQVAVRLWQRMGFTIVGTVPGAFKHATLGYVAAHIMFKDLVPYRESA